MRLITKEIIIGYELMRFASARPFLSNGSYLSRLNANKGGFSYNYLITFRCNAANFGNEVWQHLKQWCFKVAVI